VNADSILAPLLPKLSVIIPCRNEETFIAGCLDSILQNDYPHHLREIIVVDGMSSDTTGQIIQDYAGKFPLIIPLRNERRITPVALNLAICIASGEIICRIDAHARIAPDYLRRCVEMLLASGAQNVGGAMRTLPANGSLAAKCIALCMSHRFGVGNSDFRASSSMAPIFTDTVFGGCFRKEVFARIGMFNENLPRSQDFEFNQRIRCSGGRIILDPAINCDYFAARDLTAFATHNFHDGMWAILPFAHSKVVPVRLRHLAAFFALTILLLLSSAAFWLAAARIALLIAMLAYTITSLGFSAKIASKNRDPRCFFMLSLVFTIRHLAYGLGSLCGAIQLIARFALSSLFQTRELFKKSFRTARVRIEP
jgi:glycosyltransferase involved in cell wall biosynthesis